jgi:hypothetical protein
MKTFFLFISLCLTLQAECQNVKLTISTKGIDSIKIGMSEMQVEKVMGGELKPYISPDAKQSTPDSNSEVFTCNYKGVELNLAFIKYTRNEKKESSLLSIAPTSKASLVETNTGIKTGISENEFIEICKKNNYTYELLDPNDKVVVYLFSDNFDKTSFYRMFITIEDSIITSLGVADMTTYYATRQGH